MANRLDLVVFGATGFTGKYVVRELARICQTYPETTWGIAGRNQDKLGSLLKNVSNKTGADLSSVRIIIADVEDAMSLRSMCSQAKVLVNCCGPFILYGEAVVAAAVQCKTHYLDVGAEYKFLEILERKYHQAARDADVYVLTFCGLVSIPADLGVLYLEEHFGGTLNGIESYLIMDFPAKMLEEGRKNGVIRHSSWQSMITSMAHISVQQLLLKQSIIVEPELKLRSLIHKYQNKWCLPYPSADTIIVSKTQRHLLTNNDKRPVQYRPYITFSNIFSAVGALLLGLLLVIVCKVPFTRSFMLKYPRLCSFGAVTYGDTEEGVMDGSCLQYHMIGTGWDKHTDIEARPDKRVTARISVSGSDTPYTGTAVVVIYAALAILKEKNKMPKTGGVLTPGVAFRNTSLVRNLQQNDFEFQIVDDRNT